MGMNGSRRANPTGLATLGVGRRFDEGHIPFLLLAPPQVVAQQAHPRTEISQFVVSALPALSLERRQLGQVSVVYVGLRDSLQ